MYLQFLCFLWFFFYDVKRLCLFSIFQFLLEYRFKELIVDVSRQLTVCPHLLLVSLPEVSFATEPQEQAWGWVSKSFFLPFYFCPPFQFPQAFTLTKLLLCEPTAHRVTFLLARRQMLGILKMQMQIHFLFCIKSALPPYIVNLLVLSAYWSYFCMRKNEIGQPHPPQTAFTRFLPDHKNC